MARVDGLAQAFRVAAQQTVEATRKLVVTTAKRKNAEIMARDPRPATFTRYVDGHEGAPEESVKPGGVIVYRYPRVELVVQYAMEMLFKFSPVLSGEYRNAHTIYLNGVAVSNLKGWQQGDEILISNPLPYARKIEIGHMKMRVPGTSQVYEQAVSATNRRYGNIAKALYTWRGIVGGGAVNPATAGPVVKQRTIVRGENGRFGKGTRTVRVSGGAHNKSDVRFPAILIQEL